MKKIYPSLVIICIFGFLMVVQMVVHGQKLTANKIENSQEKFAVYENEFSKMKVTTTKGTKISFKEIKEPVVILNFWASWCTPCVKEFQSLNKLIEKYPGKIKVVGINNDDEQPRKKVKKMEKEYALKFESITDIAGEMASTFKVTKIPASIVYHEGKILHFSNQEFDFMNDNFINLINKKLKL